MEAIDRKYRFKAVSIESGRLHTHNDAILFLAKDALLPALLAKYEELCVMSGVDRHQIKGVQLLKERVITYQKCNINKTRLPSVEEGKEEKRVCKPNKQKGGV
jgi:hypothetical protein